jgi:hypothetical protein
MGDCVFCGKSAGLFKGQHVECALADEQVKAERAIWMQQQTAKETEKATAVSTLAIDSADTIYTGGDFVQLEHRLLDAMELGLITPLERSAILIAGYVTSIDLFLEDGLLTDDEDQRLTRFQERFAFSRNDLDATGAYSKLLKARALKTVMAGKLPDAPLLTGCTVNFQKSETPVWAFDDCRYMEDIVRKQYVGGSQGMSFRIMSGVYYRIGGFKGESLATIERRLLGSGMLIVTDQNLYFVGPGKTTCIPYSKIVSFTPFSDGFGLMRDTATAKPQFFLTADGWFAYNLVTNLVKI